MRITTSRRAQLMQILAHPDDDLYFMNPDARLMLDSGVPLVCVYVTAGEHDGVNHIPGRDPAPADKGAYSSARHQGLRQAYATLLGLDKFAEWQKGVATLRGDRRAEINTLAHGNRRVELVFLNLSMHAPRRWSALPSLWHDRALSVRTAIADDSPVRRIDSYDYDELTDVLVGLMERYRPTVIHTLDPDPDIQFSDEATRKRDSEQPRFSDHADHTAVASFSWAAMVRWVAESTRDGGGIPAFVATSFRGYYNRHWPKNLPRPVIERKASHLVPYGGDPDWECGNSGGCGDYNVGGRRPLTNTKGWVRSTHRRYPGARTAVAADPDGRLVAYGVLGLRAVRWRETRPGSGNWNEPDDLGGGPLAPVLGTAALADGRRLIFALRFSEISGHRGGNSREIVLLEQRAPGGEFHAWRGLGNPERSDSDGRRIGVPVAVTAPDGRVHLFVRDAGKGVSTRVRGADGAWGDWRALDGDAEVQDGLTAVVDGTGRVHLFGTGRDTVHHWAQDAPGEPLRHRPAGRLPAAVDPPAVLAGPGEGGSVRLLYRTEAPWRPASPADSRGSASLRAVLFTAEGERLPAGFRFDGYGPLTAAPAPNSGGTGGAPGRSDGQQAAAAPDGADTQRRTGTPDGGAGSYGHVLVGRDLHGRIQMHHEGRLLTRTTGPVPLDTPAPAVTPAGPTLVGMGPDAHPWTWSPRSGAAG
jgi:LmbE family N-acetylglucosaminyl deacetylase